MPDVLEAPLVAKTFDDGYGSNSAGRAHFRLGGLSLSPWTWSLGSSMSGGVEVSARGGLRLATTHSPYVVEEGTSPASLLQRHHPHHLQHQRPSRYYPHLHPLSSTQQQQHNSTHHQRQHLSNLENLSHHRPPPLHLLHPRHTGKSAAAASGGRCVPLSADPTMRANERWVLLNKETFQEIFDATLHQMTYAPGELLSGGADDRKSSTSSSSERDAEDGAGSPPSPTTPEGLRCQRAAPTLCSRKRTLSDVAAEDEAEAERSSFRRASPLIAMAPTESAKTPTSALNDITNDRPGQRYSPAITSSARSSTPTSPRLTSPGTLLTSPHSPQGTVAPPNPERENNEPLDLSNKRSPVTETVGNPINSDSDSNNAEWSPRPSSSNNNNSNCPQRAMSPYDATPAPTGGGMGEAVGTGRRQGSPGLGAPPSSSTTTNTTVTNADRQTQPPPPRTPPAAAELRQKASPEGGPVRANGSYAPVDPRAPSPRGTEAGGGGGRGGVAAGGGRLGEEDARGGTPTTNYPALAEGGESSSSSSSHHASVGGRGAGGGGSSSSTASTATAPVISTSTTEPSCSNTSRITTTTTTAQTTCNNTTIVARTAGRDSHLTPHQTLPSHTRDAKSSNSVTPQTSTSKTLPDGPSGVSRMIADTSGDPAARVATSGGKATTTSVTSRQSTTSGQVMKHASENWMLLNKTTVYDLVEEVMFSLGEDEEEKVSALRDSSNHHRTMSPGVVSSTPLQQQSQQYKSVKTASSSNNNNNNNALKRTHAEMQDEGHTGRRHRCSPPLPLERCVNQGQAQEDRTERSDDNVSSSRPAAGSLRPAVSTTKSQLRDHLSARSQHGRLPLPSSTSSRVFNYSDPAPRVERLSQQQLSRCSPVRGTCPPPGDSSSSTSPTPKTKQQQCWVALNKNLVYNIVDSAMRNSETEEEDEEEMEKNAPSDPKSEVNGHGSDSSRVGLGGMESDSNSNSSSEGGSDNNNGRPNPNPKSTSDFDIHSQQLNGSKKRPCDNTPPCITTGPTALEKGECVSKKSRVATPSPPACSPPASPLRTSVTEGPSEDSVPSGGVTGARRTCLEGLLSESTGRRTPPARHLPLKPAIGEAPTSSATATVAGNDGGSKVRKSVHLADSQHSRIDNAAQSATSHPHKAGGNMSARSSPSTLPCSASSKNQSSSHRVSNQVRSATTTAIGRGCVSRDQVKVLTTSGSVDDGKSHTKHGLVPLPASKHGLVPVSPSPTDARSSPRLGWVAVSKVDVHNIVDSVVDSMIVGDPVTSSSSPPPPEVDTGSNPQSPVPSPPSSSMSPPHVSNVTSPVPGRDAESSHRASSPLRPSLTVGPRSPEQQEPEIRGRGTPSPVMASPESPRSPCDALDRCSDSKAATKAFKWKSSLLMRVEEEKIDVTPEVATTSGRSGPQRVSGKPASKSESRSLRSGKRGSRKGGSSSTNKLK